MSEPPDHHHYGPVLLYEDTLKFLQAAIQFYESLLRRDAQEIASDPDLKLFVTSEESERFSIHEELARAERVRAWLDGLVNEDSRFGAHPTMSHGTVRFLKSVAHLYLKQLQMKREALAARPNISREALSAVDQKLAALREKVEMGVFKEATVRPLLADEIVVAQIPVCVASEVSEQSLAGARQPRPVVLDSIEVVDPELRNRCLDLFGQFTETGQHDRLDTVISEATRILEDRLRRLAGAAPTVVGTDLASYALSGSTPRIVLSAVGAEQEAAHLLFRGVFGFVRNRVHHHLVADVSPVRALQIVGTVDYLLSLLAAVPLNAGTA
jgi:hypothetical protein